jgi:hypothetical protein
LKIDSIVQMWVLNDHFEEDQVVEVIEWKQQNKQGNIRKISPLAIESVELDHKQWDVDEKNEPILDSYQMQNIFSNDKHDIAFVFLLLFYS